MSRALKSVEARRGQLKAGLIHQAHEATRRGKEILLFPSCAFVSFVE